jgi:hypothetical protein
MLVVAGALLLTLVAGVAVARTYTCDDNNCPGTNNADSITGDGSNQTFTLMGGSDLGRGKGGADELRGGGGDDELRGGRGADELRDRGGDGDTDEHFGGRGSDLIRADDGDTNDFVDCGRGADDVAYIDVDNRDEDRVADNCDEVIEE